MADSKVTDLSAVTPVTTDAYYAYAGKASGSLDKKVLLGGAAGLDVGTASGTVAAGNDARMAAAPIVALAAVTPAANKLPYFDSTTTATVADFTAAGRALVDDADASAQRTTLGLAIGTNVQAYSANLAAVAGVTVTAAGTALLDDADATAQRTTLGLGTAATTAATAYATSTQGTTADAAMVGAGTVVDNSAVRQDSTTGRISQPSVLLIADTTADLSRSGNGGIDIQGTNTNDDAASGQIGEYLETIKLSGAASGITTATAADIVQLSLTAGDWDVWGSIALNAGAGTLQTAFFGWLSTTSGTLPTAPNGGAYTVHSYATSATGNSIIPIGMRRLSLSGTTIVYLSTLVAFSVSTMAAYGILAARRVR